MRPVPRYSNGVSIEVNRVNALQLINFNQFLHCGLELESASKASPSYFLLSPRQSREVRFYLSPQSVITEQHFSSAVDAVVKKI